MKITFEKSPPQPSTLSFDEIQSPGLYQSVQFEDSFIVCERNKKYYFNLQDKSILLQEAAIGWKQLKYTFVKVNGTLKFEF